MESQSLYLVSIIALLLPPMPDDQFARLVESTRELGQLEEITMWRGAVVDGCHQLLACLRLGIEPKFRHLPDDAGPLEYVAGRRALSRHMTAGRLAIAAFRASRLSTPGRPRGSAENCANLRSYLTQGQAADLFGVSRRSVSTVARVLGPESMATPELRQLLLSGRLSPSDAVTVAGEPHEVQRQAVEMVRRGQYRTARRAADAVRAESAGGDDGGALDAAGTAEAGATVTLHAAPLARLPALVEPESVDAMITFPPADAASKSMLAELAAFAAHALKESGGMFVLAGTERLPDFLEGLRHSDLKWACSLHYSHPGRPARLQSHGVSLSCKLVLVYGKRGFRLEGGDDVINVPPLAEGATGNRHSPRLGLGMELMVERFTRPGQVVCDPLLLRREDSALAAVRLGRGFIGAWEDEAFIARLRARLGGAERHDDALDTGRSV